jgi:hypothetical protein
LLCSPGQMYTSVTEFNNWLLIIKKSIRERFLLSGSEGIYVNSFRLGLALKGSIRFAALQRLRKYSECLLLGIAFMLITSGLLIGGRGEMVQFQSPPMMTGRSPRAARSFCRVSIKTGLWVYLLWLMPVCVVLIMVNCLFLSFPLITSGV